MVIEQPQAKPIFIAFSNTAAFKTGSVPGCPNEITLTGTGSLELPTGTTAQRPGSAAAGMFRYNSTTGEFEGYTSAWGSIGGGASAGGVIYENNLTVTSNYTLSTNTNGMSVGPITLSGGVTVTIPSGQRWVIL